MPPSAPPPGLPPSLFGLDPSEDKISQGSGALGSPCAEALRRLPPGGRTLILAGSDIPAIPATSEMLGPESPLPTGPFQALWVHEWPASADPPAMARTAVNLLEPGAVLVLSGPVRYAAGGPPWPSGGEQAAALAEAGFCILERERLGGRILLAPSGTGAGDLRPAFSAGRLGYEIIVARRDDRPVRAYRPGDEGEILALFKQQFHVERSEGHFRWKYLESPFGGPCMSLIFSDVGSLLAHYAGYPVPFHRSGPTPEAFTAMHVGDTMTRPEGRRMGLGRTSLLARATLHFYARYLEERTAFAFGFNTGRIRTFGSRYMEYGYLEPVTVWTLASSAARPSGFLGGWRAGRVATPTAEFDRFFERAARRYGLLIRRDAGYLGWRYFGRPDRTYALYAVRRWGRLRGWGVFGVDEGKLLWGDALLETGDPRAAEALLGAALQDHAGVSVVEGWFPLRPAWWADLLRSLGFQTAEEPRGLAYCYKTFARPDLEGPLREGLYYTRGDGDLF